jgi:hypothetical protein
MPNPRQPASRKTKPNPNLVFNRGLEMRLGKRDLIVLVALAFDADRSGRLGINQEDMAKRLRIPRSSLNKALQTLKDKAIVKVAIARGGRGKPDHTFVTLTVEGPLQAQVSSEGRFVSTALKLPGSSKSHDVSEDRAVPAKELPPSTFRSASRRKVRRKVRDAQQAELFSQTE